MEVSLRLYSRQSLLSKAVVLLANIKHACQIVVKFELTVDGIARVEPAQ